jgi:hypothetical protein
MRTRTIKEDWKAWMGLVADAHCLAIGAEGHQRLCHDFTCVLKSWRRWGVLSTELSLSSSSSSAPSSSSSSSAPLLITRRRFVPARCEDWPLSLQPAAASRS